jgi:hypothetical protein
LENLGRCKFAVIKETIRRRSGTPSAARGTGTRSSALSASTARVKQFNEAARRNYLKAGLEMDLLRFRQRRTCVPTGVAD